MNGEVIALRVEQQEEGAAEFFGDQLKERLEAIEANKAQEKEVVGDNNISREARLKAVRGKTWEEIEAEEKSTPEALDIGLRLPFGDEDSEYLIPGVGITMIGAGTSHGKSTLLLNSALHLLRAGKKVVFYSLEEKTVDVFQRLFLIAGCGNGEPINKNPFQTLQRYRREGKVDPKYVSRYGLDNKPDEDVQNARIKKFTKAIEEGIEEVSSYRKNNQLYITESIGKEVSAIEAEISALIQDKDKPDVVMVDYAQLVNYSKSDSRSGDRRLEELRVVMEKLIEAVNRHNVPIILTAQLNRKAISPKHLSIHCVEEAASLAQGASCFIALWNHNFKQQKNESSQQDESPYKGYIELQVLKSRNGTKPTFRVPARLEHYFIDFESPEKVEGGDTVTTGGKPRKGNDNKRKERRTPNSSGLLEGEEELEF